MRARQREKSPGQTGRRHNERRNDASRTDGGARGHYVTMSGEIDLSGLGIKADETIKATLSGFSVGPVLRGRWYLVDDSIAIGPEIYFKYSDWGTNIEALGEDADGPGATIMELEYSLRMDFYF